MEKAQHIKILFDKYLVNEYSAEELQELLGYFQTTDEVILNELIGEEISAGNNVLEDHPMVTAIIEEMDIELMSKSKPQKIRMRKLRLWIPIAASLFVILSFGIFLYFNEQASSSNGYANDVAPGKNGATLVLSNGKTIRLNDIKNGELASEHGVKITKTANGELLYEIVGNEAADGSQNTLQTAVGETYALILPDGSKVWLNASSSISYPSRFSGHAKRSVELLGEAYFEVAKDKNHPFIVNTTKEKVEVLGTHFNINGYPEEKRTLTTLLEGSVKVSSITNGSVDETGSALLKPGQQSTIGANGISVANVQVEDAVAWKNGYFMFNSERLESVMLRVARWYNVSIEYSDPEVKNEEFFGTISKSAQISSVLKMLEGTGVVVFQIKGNHIIISKKKD